MNRLMRLLRIPVGDKLERDSAELIRQVERRRKRAHISRTYAMSDGYDNFKRYAKRKARMIYIAMILLNMDELDGNKSHVDWLREVMRGK